MSGELKLIDQFIRFVAGKKNKPILLTHDQTAVADAIFKTAEGKRLVQGAGTGKTFLFRALEDFSHEIAPKPAKKEEKK